jgi:hypothetical protein
MFRRSGNPPMYLPGRERGPSRSTLAAAALTVVSLIFVAGVVGIPIAKPAPALDPKTGCAPGMLDEQVVVVIDLTDPVREAEMLVVLAEIERRARALPAASRLTVRTIAPGNKQLAEPLFDRCKPKDGSMVSPLTGNPKMQDDTYARQFGDPLGQAKSLLSQLAKTNREESSPIIGKLADVINDESFAQARRHSVFVASDLVEHSAIADMTRAGFDFGVVRRAGLKPVRDLQGRLAGAEVSLLQIRRAEVGQYQTAAQRRFWVELLTYAGVDTERLRYDRL